MHGRTMKPIYPVGVKLRSYLLPASLLLTMSSAAHAVTVRISPQALERTLQNSFSREPRDATISAATPMGVATSTPQTLTSAFAMTAS